EPFRRTVIPHSPLSSLARPGAWAAGFSVRVGGRGDGRLVPSGRRHSGGARVLVAGGAHLRDHRGRLLARLRWRGGGAYSGPARPDL
ncbi:MAG: hypothetical protein AVDCRST_MAG89-4408, partial [uncultured Gemmatimonadetes bacterium]